jgi:Protein of unknown function (DUF1579)
MNENPHQEHRWLDKLVGEWTSEMECTMGPGQPLITLRGTESVRSLGGLWTIGEGEGNMPEGGSSKSVMTLGYDPKAGRFVGTFIASVMTHLWTYTGSLDESGKVLTLDAEGPSFTSGETAKYQDRIEFVDDDHRILTSQALGDDGEWRRFMTAHYRRKK